MPAIWRNLEKNKKLFNEASKSNPIIIFDTETTGLGKDAEIIELAAAKCIFQEGAFWITSYIDLFIKPKNPVSDDASAVNGITNEFLEDKPMEEEIFPIIRDYFGPDPKVGAYNSAFDIGKMSSLYERQGETFAPSLNIDFYQIAKDIFCCEKMKDMKLGTIADTYGVTDGITFHSAIDDVRVLIRVMNAMITDIKTNSDNSDDLDVKVGNLYFSEGYRGNTRLYVSTSSGRIYYSFKDDKWVTWKDGPDPKTIRMDKVEQKVFEVTGTSDYKELRKYCMAKGTGPVW